MVVQTPRGVRLLAEHAPAAAPVVRLIDEFNKLPESVPRSASGLPTTFCAFLPRRPSRLRAPFLM